MATVHQRPRPKVPARVLFSPVVELLAAGHFLSEEKHRLLNPRWVDKARQALSSESWDLLSRLSPIEYLFLGLFDLPIIFDNYSDPDRFCGQLEELSAEEFFFYWWNQEIALDEIRRGFEAPDWIRRFHDETDFSVRGSLTNSDGGPILYVFGSLDLSEQLLKDPKGFQSRIVRFFRELWALPLLEDLEAMDYRFLEARRYVDRLLETRNPFDVAMILKGRSIEAVPACREILFIPSYFLAYHNFMGYLNDTLVVTFSLQNVRSESPAAESVSKVMKALGDKTRLKIFRLIFQKPTYGKLIADRLEITPATVSRHLSILKDVGLIEEEIRDGAKYFVHRQETLFRELKNLEHYLLGKD